MSHRIMFYLAVGGLGILQELDWSFKGIVSQKINYRNTYTDVFQMLYGVQLGTDTYRDGCTEYDTLPSLKFIIF